MSTDVISGQRFSARITRRLSSGAGSGGYYFGIKILVRFLPLLSPAARFITGMCHIESRFLYLLYFVVISTSATELFSERSRSESASPGTT